MNITLPDETPSWGNIPNRKRRFIKRTSFNIMASLTSIAISNDIFKKTYERKCDINDKEITFLIVRISNFKVFNMN